jgi:hypothetical protein
MASTSVIVVTRDRGDADAGRARDGGSARAFAHRPARRAGAARVIIDITKSAYQPGYLPKTGTGVFHLFFATATVPRTAGA